MESNFNQTLDRLKGGNIEDAWWRKVLDKIGHTYIAPEFLKKKALHEWLADSTVAGHLRTLAKEIVMGKTGGMPEIRGRLADRCSDITRENRQDAAHVVDVVVAVLVAGYIASISPDLRPVAGMLQEINRRFDELEESALPNLERSIARRFPIVQQTLTQQAEYELSQILTLRAFDADRSRRRITELHKQVTDCDLAAASDSIKTQIRYWAARLLATEIETLPEAISRREELRQTGTDLDLSVVDALIAETQGETDKALRILRNCGDPDARAVWFSLLLRVKGKEAVFDWCKRQDNRNQTEFFTPVGWVNWAILRADSGEWEKAVQRLALLEVHWDEMPKLAVVEGVINAAMLLPSDFRKEALNGAPFLKHMDANQDEAAQRHHSRATACLEFAEKSLEHLLAGDGNWAKEIADWLLWLRLMNPVTQYAQTARDEVTRYMQNGAQAIEAIRFAYTFDIAFNEEPLRDYLRQRKETGGLDDHELRAECFLNSQSMHPGNLASYLRENKARLVNVMSPAILASMHVDALEKDGRNPEEKQALVDEYADGLDESHINRLRTFIDAHAGKDIREQLEIRFRETDSLVDLRNLISQLKMANDHAALRPLTRKLFDRAPTIANAIDVVVSMGAPGDFDHQSIIDFLERNPVIVEQSDDLKILKAIALFNAGRLRESREVNDTLLDQRTTPDKLRLDFDIAVASGEWERLGGILDRAWDQQDLLDAETLIAFAHTAGQQGQIDRALKLATAAAGKAPKNPQVLTAAYDLYFRLGHDKDANPDWLRNATELSSAEEGPVWRVSLQDLVTKRVPKHDEHLRKVERKWLDGDIPMSLASEQFNVSLARLLLLIPKQNANEQDGRNRVPLPIIAGERKPVELQETWTIGLDINSVMILAYLGVLEKAINSFHHVKLAPNIMELLFDERGKAHFHQPSRVAAAKQALELQSRGRLLFAEISAAPIQVHANEVGSELAELLQMARNNNGIVVCDLPIHKPGSLMEREADTSEFKDLILPVMDFCNLLHNRGKIGTEDYQRARLLLASQGQTEGANPSASILDGPVYVDRLAFSYLLETGVVEVATATGLQFGIHPSVAREMRGLSEAGDIGQELAEKLEGIRQSLLTAMDQEKASFLPRANNRNEQMQVPEVRFEATTSLLAGAASYDALCIDDRFINSRSLFLDGDELSIPIVCVLDVLRYLVSRQQLRDSEYRSVRHKLRQSGFAFIHPEPDELFHWLKRAMFNNDQLVESAELRVLRQATARAQALDLANWAEGFGLIANSWSVYSQVIAALWEDQELPTDKVTKLSDWVWRNLLTISVPGRKVIEHDAQTGLIGDLVALRLGGLLSPVRVSTQQRASDYTEWVEQSVLQQLWPANADSVGEAIVSVRTTISSALSGLDVDKTAYGHLFLSRLPESARQIVIDQDPEFARQCGIEMAQVVSIGTEIELTDKKLFESARQVLTSGQEESVQDIAGQEVLIRLDKESQNIVVTRADAEGDSPSVEIPDLALLSPKPETRREALYNIIDRLGPTAKDFRYLLQHIQSREPSQQELATIFNETTNGVSTKQAALTRNFSHGARVGFADILPSSISYFERFCGPDPGESEPDAYFREVLIPYRKDLLARDLAAGLDICCLGALSDELTPGEWVCDIDNDAVWSALTKCHAQSNPFSLLGALDIALYRQDDERFEQLAEKAVAQLTDSDFGQQDGDDVYGLLQVIYVLVLNRINLLRDGAKHPGYWKRMSAWMQAGLIVRAMTGPPASTFAKDTATVEQWTGKHMIMAGFYADFIDARIEPMLAANRMPQRDLRNELYGRLDILRLRHTAAGREFPKSARMNHEFAQEAESGRNPLWDFPGPLEGHKRPSRPLPQDFSKALTEEWEQGSGLAPFQSPVIAAQLFVLGSADLERAKKATKAIGQSNGGDLDASAVLKRVELVSLVAAAARDRELANGVAEAVERIASDLSEEETREALAVMLQAAAAHEEHDEWFKWLEDKLADIASRLPQQSLREFLAHLGEMETILPASSWFFLPARATALAGAP